ncbi:hypothetical protein [Streptomyces sp. SAJ15]|uniref:hypothetical protein n=1 Tax=Streptomyces sp. SAJ15 TaxID=2011095 RepID=UPI0037DA4CD4
MLHVVRLLHQHRELADAALSMVPVGTSPSVALARSLGVPTGAVAAARTVLDGRERRLDVLVDDSGGVVLGGLHIPSGGAAYDAYDPPYEGHDRRAAHPDQDGYADDVEDGAGHGGYGAYPRGGSVSTAHGPGEGSSDRTYDGDRAGGPGPRGIPGARDRHRPGDGERRGGVMPDAGSPEPGFGDDGLAGAGGPPGSGGGGSAADRHHAWWSPAARTARSALALLTLPVPGLGPGTARRRGREPGQRLRVEADGVLLADLDQPVERITVSTPGAGLAEVLVRSHAAEAPVRARARAITVSGPDFRYRADAHIAGPVRTRTWTVLDEALRLLVPHP